MSGIRFLVSTAVAVTLLLTLQAWAANAGAAGLKVSRAWVRLPLLPDEPVQAYFNLSNSTKASHKIVGAKSPRADRVELHETVFEDGQETTRKIKEWEVPGPGAVIFSPGGVLLVLFGAGELSEGEKIPIELELADGTKLSMQALVRDE